MSQVPDELVNLGNISIGNKSGSVGEEQLRTKKDIVKEFVDVNTKNFTAILPDGRSVEMAEPKGSVQWKAAMLCPTNLSSNISLLGMIQMILYIDKIDGKPQVKSTFNQIQAIADILGDENIAYLQLELEDHYPTSQSLKDKLKAVRGL